ncbi:MAG: RluA family pseudouridine synthase [Lachnospiraceae bacterium]|jgi:23S rRNA pseudouridine955/2504/2580 synthase|nr:RluA family pseudouridine synthase [Lachnospiraceae bacterium]MCI9099812.1 RluA family pseudouridine synthase [Lachnospiraceae bacterium]MCI9356108.1 RluA family pseudouridine synthase [Lachnospiraceae bacterium]
MKQVSVSETDAGQRLDKYLHKILTQAPKGFLYKMLRKKNITLNGKKAGGSERLCPGDEIQMFLSQETLDKFSEPHPAETARQSLEQEPDIIYEDDQVLLLNKPCGVLSQKSCPEDYSLSEWVRDYLCRGGKAAGFSPGVCNRLDRNTSGIVAAGKSVRAQQELSAMFQKRQMGKYYLCPVQGILKQQEHLRGYLQKSESQNKVFIWEDKKTGGLGRDKRDYVETVYRPLGDNGRLTLLEVQLITGKTHQIRAHLAQTGHPVSGDRKYGLPGAKGDTAWQQGLRHQMLHAWKLEFPECTGLLKELSGMRYAAELPGDFRSFLEREHLEECMP